jgi:hypothetical protein
MPCGDITDTITLTLSPDDRLLDYRLEKKTCGAPVGEFNLLIDWLRDQPADGILSQPFQDFARQLTITDATTEFVCWKHYRTVLAGLAAYLGESNEASAAAAVVGIDFAGDGVEVTVEVKHDLPAENVKPCGTGCGDCSGACGASARQARRAKVAARQQSA